MGLRNFIVIDGIVKLSRLMSKLFPSSCLMQKHWNLSGNELNKVFVTVCFLMFENDIKQRHPHEAADDMVNSNCYRKM